MGKGGGEAERWEVELLYIRLALYQGIRCSRCCVFSPCEVALVCDCLREALGSLMPLGKSVSGAHGRKIMAPGFISYQGCLTLSSNTRNIIYMSFSQDIVSKFQRKPVYSLSIRENQGGREENKRNAGCPPTRANPKNCPSPANMPNIESKTSEIGRFPFSQFPLP